MCWLVLASVDEHTPSPDANRGLAPLKRGCALGLFINLRYTMGNMEFGLSWYSKLAPYYDAKLQTVCEPTKNAKLRIVLIYGEQIKTIYTADIGLF